MNKLRIPYDAFKNLPLKLAVTGILAAPRLKIADLKLYDLIFEDCQPTTVWHGIYVFFSAKGECLYVGKASAANFIERVPWHFALHEEAWMNYFLKRVRKAQGMKELWEAALFAAECEILLIPVSDGDVITRLEKFLRIHLVPKYNKYSDKFWERFQNYNQLAPVSNLISAM